MKPAFPRVVRAVLWGVIFGVFSAYLGTYLGHVINNSASPAIMYARDSRFFWLTIPALPGEAFVALATSRDWMFDDAWVTYRHPIAFYNALFWAGAFPVFRPAFVHGISFLLRNVRNAIHAHQR